MGRHVGRMVQEASGLQREVYEGWSWPAFFFGPFWYLVKGMWGYGLLYLLIAFGSVGIGWFIGLFVAPFLANGHLRDHLGARGYRLERNAR